MQRRLRLALVLSACSFAACMSSDKGEDAQPVATVGPTDAFLDSVHNSFIGAIKAKDATPMLAFYADNATSYSPNMDPLRGKAAIAEYNTQWFANIDPDSIAAGRDDVVTSGDVAVEAGWYYFKGKMFGQPAEDRGRYINVWQRQADGSWKIVRDMSNSSLPMPGTQPPAGAEKK